MTAFFDAVAGVIGYLVDFVLDVVKVVGLTASAIAKLPVYLGYIYPNEIVASLAVFFTVVVLYKVLGRDS